MAFLIFKSDQLTATGIFVSIDDLKETLVFNKFAKDSKVILAFSIKAVMYIVKTINPTAQKVNQNMVILQ